MFVNAGCAKTFLLPPPPYLSLPAHSSVLLSTLFNKKAAYLNTTTAKIGVHSSKSAGHTSQCEGSTEGEDKFILPPHRRCSREQTTRPLDNKAPTARVGALAARMRRHIAGRTPTVHQCHHALNKSTVAHHNTCYTFELHIGCKNTFF